MLTDQQVQGLKEQLKNSSPKIWGPRAWKDLEAIVDGIPCSSCKAHGKKALSAMHDLQNIDHGKPIFDEANFKEVARHYTEALHALEGDHDGHQEQPEKEKEKERDKEGDKGFNIQKLKNNPRMALLSTGDIGLVVGAEFAAKGVEKILSFVDQAMGVPATAPVLSKPSSFATPVIGAALVLMGAVVHKIKDKHSAQLAAVVLGGHMLAKVIDTVEVAAGITPAGIGLVLQSPQSYVQQASPAVGPGTGFYGSPVSANAPALF